MLSRRLIPFALAAAFFAVSAAHAQDASIRVAICNPAKVFESMEERQAINTRMVTEIQQIEAEKKRRQAELTELDGQRKLLKENSPLYQEKTKQMMEKAVEYEVWARLKEAEIARSEKEQIISLYDKIAEAAKEVAEGRKIDLVLAERRPEIPTNPEQFTRLTPDQVRSILSQRDVLHFNDRVDITQAVIALVNKKYAAGQAGAGASGPSR